MAIRRFEVLGVEDPVRRLKKIQALLDDPVGIQDLFVQAAEIFKEEAIRRVPVHSGRLRSMIKVERRGAKYPVAVLVVHASDVRYVSFVEFGSRHSAAEPFIRPTLDSRGPAVVDFIGRNLRVMIETAAA